MTHILYGAPLSLYSGKARAYLDWKTVDYEEVLSTADIYREVILPNIGRPVIPVMQTAQGEILQDTTCIIDCYEATEPGPSVYPDTPRQRLAALLLECFGDEWLVIPAMHYRWNYNEEWAYAEFGKTSLPGGTKEEQYSLGKERAGPFRGSLPILGVNEQTIPATNGPVSITSSATGNLPFNSRTGSALNIYKRVIDMPRRACRSRNP